MASSSIGRSSSSIRALWRSLQAPYCRQDVRSFAVRKLPVISFSDSQTRSKLMMHRKPRAEPVVKMEEKFGISADRNPSEYRLADLRVWSWNRWECDASKFPWKYEVDEMCYLVKGRARIYAEGREDDFLEVGSGDLIIFPKGLSCTWDVMTGIDKFYRLYT